MEIGHSLSRPATLLALCINIPILFVYQAQIHSNINQFISIQFAEESAVVNVVNSEADPAPRILAVGRAKNQYNTNVSQYQTISWSLQGNGQQLVFVNADSVQDSQGTSISLQSLSAQYA